MARKVKKGSYWKTLGEEPTQILVALEDGYSNTVVEFAKIVDGKRGSFCGRIVDMDGLYRCKKNGEWFSSGSEVAQLNRKFLSLKWRIHGAFRNLMAATYQLKQLDMEEFSGYDWEIDLAVLTRDIDIARKRAIDKLRKELALRDRSAAATKEQGKC